MVGMQQRVAEPRGIGSFSALASAQLGPDGVAIATAAPLFADREPVADQGRHMLPPHARAGMILPAPFGWVLYRVEDLQYLDPLLAESARIQASGRFVEVRKRKKGLHRRLFVPGLTLELRETAASSAFPSENGLPRCRLRA